MGRYSKDEYYATRLKGMALNRSDTITIMELFILVGEIVVNKIMAKISLRYVTHICPFLPPCLMVMRADDKG